MAIVILNTGERKIIKPEEAGRVWEILNSERDPEPEEELLAMSVTQIFIPWRSASDSYIRANLKRIAPQVREKFVVDTQGRALYPDPTDEASVEFTRKYLTGRVA